MRYITSSQYVSQNQFTAFYGALKCDKLATINHCNVDEPDFLFAIASCNQDIVNISCLKFRHISHGYSFAIKYHNNFAFDFIFGYLNFSDLFNESNISLTDAISNFNERYFYYSIETLEKLQGENFEFQDYSPLRTACQLENVSIVEYLVKNKLCLEDMDMNYNPLHAACMCGNFDIVKILVSNKVVDVDAKARVTFNYYYLFIRNYLLFF